MAYYEDILARLESLPTPVEQTIAAMQEGLKLGYTPPKITMRDLPKQLADLIPGDAMKSPLLAPFQQFPPAIGEADRVKLTERASKIYADRVAPSFAKLRNFFGTTNFPRLPGKHCGDGAARWSSGICVPCALADDHEADAAADSRDWAGGGETDS